MRLFDGPKRDMCRKWWPGSCLKDAFVCGWAQSCIRIPSTPEIDGFIPPMTPIWKNDALMHVYWELETLGSRRELRWYELTTWLFIFYFIFIYFRGFFSLSLVWTQHVIGRKLRGNVRICSNYSSCMMCQQNGRWQHFSESRRNENGGHNPRNLMFLAGLCVVYYAALFPSFLISAI